MARVLIACEFSGIVRDAFLKAGHDAISCDLLPTESPGPHIQGDVSPLLKEPWDLVIAHPPCTYLANSGVRWLYKGGSLEGGADPERWEALRKGVEFFKECLNANSPRVAVENPVMHKWALEAVGWEPNCRIQPWQFGHGETKAICFWLLGVPPLKPTNIVDGRNPRVHHESPGKDRWKRRSRFYTGIAEAMADQWGSLL